MINIDKVEEFGKEDPINITFYVAFKKLSENAKEPTKGSEYAAGFDLYSANTENITIPPHKTVLIPTDIAMEIPTGFFGGIYARSGLATKEGLRPANCVGIVDSDYRGNIGVALHNDTLSSKTITPGERIAQLIVQPFFVCDLKEVTELKNTVRGDGGFGSTGKE